MTEILKTRRHLLVSLAVGILAGSQAQTAGAANWWDVDPNADADDDGSGVTASDDSYLVIDVQAADPPPVQCSWWQWWC